MVPVNVRSGKKARMDRLNLEPSSSVSFVLDSTKVRAKDLVTNKQN